MTLYLLTGLIASVWAGPQNTTQSVTPTQVDCDVVIADAGLGGVAAALQSAKLGVKTCMTSMTDWIGGQMTTEAVSAIDEPYQFSDGDLEFLHRYAKKKGDHWVVQAGPKTDPIAPGIYSDSPHTDEVLRTLSPVLDQLELADCWVSTHCFKPSAGNRALKSLLEPYIKSGKLTIFYESVVKRVQLDTTGAITAVEFVQREYTGNGPKPYTTVLSSEILDWYDLHDSQRFKKHSLRLTGKIFIDSTEFGELIVLSHAQHHLGYEGEKSIAPEPECVMGFDVPINLVVRNPNPTEAAVLASAVNPSPAIEPYSLTAEGDYFFWQDNPTPNGLSVFEYRQISEKPPVTAMNWNPGNDFSAENIVIPVALLGDQLTDWKGGIRVDALQKAEQRSYSFAAWLNQQPDVKFKGRQVAPNMNLQSPDNFFGTGTGLAKFPYIRETRRIDGFDGFRVTATDIGTNSGHLGDFDGPQYTHFSDSVGIGSYPIDLRICPTGRKFNFNQSFANHYQIPLRSLVSANVSNLMVASKALAVDQIANAAYRLHPTEWNAGFGAGTAAAVAVQHHLALPQLMRSSAMIQAVQRQVVDSGGHVLWFRDGIPSLVPARSKHR